MWCWFILIMMSYLFPNHSHRKWVKCRTLNNSLFCWLPLLNHHFLSTGWPFFYSGWLHRISNVLHVHGGIGLLAAHIYSSAKILAGDVLVGTLCLLGNSLLFCLTAHVTQVGGRSAIACHCLHCNYWYEQRARRFSHLCYLLIWKLGVLVWFRVPILKCFH